MAAWRAGEASAGAELFDRHFAAVTRFFRHKAGDRLDDLVQATFMTLLESPQAYRGEGSFRGFMLGVAYNVLRHHLRDVHRERRIELGDVSVEALGIGPASVIDADRERRRLLEALRRIPLDHQTLLELFYWESLSASAIGQVLGIPEGTVRTRLRRARVELERELAKIVDNGEELHSTLARLEDWARGRQRDP